MNEQRLSRWVPLVFVALGLSVAGCQPSSEPVNTCSFDNAIPVTHAVTTITADETWEAGVHIVPSSVTVRDGARLTLSPCSEIRLASNASLIADSSSAGIDAMGTADNPIYFVRDDPSVAWGSLLVWGPAVMRLANATLDGGGGTLDDYAGASLVARGTPDELPKALHAEHVTVARSTGVGVALISAKFDATSTDLTITESGAQPLYAGLDLADTIPTGEYTGNATDEILLQSVGPAAYDNNRPLVHDGALHDRGVPYHATADLAVGDGNSNSGPALLTVDAGVTVLFDADTRFSVRGHMNGVGAWVSQGALIISGTATQPVRLTSASATPAAGDWVGLYFANVLDPRTSVSGAVIEYAGGDSQARGVCEYLAGSGDVSADCGVVVFLEADQLPASRFISDTQIAESAGCGIYRGWQDADIDFRVSNTFVAVPGCLQSNVPATVGGCGSTACPML